MFQLIIYLSCFNRTIKQLNSVWIHTNMILFVLN